MYKLSIIMPIFNTEKYIKRSFRSILNQTMDLNDIEVIMVDDCSTDGTRDIVKKYEEKYSNFKAIYHEKNSGGCAIPRNSGLKVATGEYIMFLDPDDEYAPDMCETLYNEINNSDYNMVKCNHTMVIDGTVEIDYIYDKNIPKIEIDCKTESPPTSVSVCNTIHTRKFLIDNEIKFFNLKNGEDAIFSTEEFFYADKMLILNNYAGYYYYTNPEVSHSRKPTSENLDVSYESYLIAKKLIDKHDRTELYPKFFSIRFEKYFILLLDFEGNRKKYLKKYYEFEKSLNCALKFRFLWMNIVNFLVNKKQFILADYTIKAFGLIRNSPIVYIYRKI